MSTETDNSQVLAALERLSTRLDRLEAKLDANPVARRAGEPEVSATLDRLVDRLDKLEAAVEMLGHLAERVPVLADAAGHVATWAWNQALDAGVDPIEAGRAGATLALRAGTPEKLELAGNLLDDANIALLRRLLAQRETLSLALDAAERVDRDDLKVVLEQGAAMTGKLAALLNAPELSRLLDAGPTAVGVAESASTALVETKGIGVEPVGPVGALFALRDPDVQKAVGFGLAVARRFGARL